VYDPAFDPTRPTAPTAAPPAVIADVADESVRRVCNPIERLNTDATAKIDIPGMLDLRDRIRKNPKRTDTLFKENPGTTIDIAPRKQP
jgi:hypothetical protein